MANDDVKMDTMLAHAGCEVDKATAALTPPIHFSSTYERDRDLDYRRGYIYARLDNPTRNLLEKQLSMLEGGDQSACFGSGQAAAAALLQSIPKGYIIVPDDMYHGISTLLKSSYAEWGLAFDEVDTSKVECVKTAIAKWQQWKAHSGNDVGRLVVWIESPSNPLTKVSDISTISNLVHSHGGIVVVDSTWCTPWITQPIKLGADFVLHSLTKYIAGHSDLIGGALISSNAADAQSLFTKIRHMQTYVGGGLSPFDCWLCLRGMRSLGARMRLHCINAMAVATFLDTHPAISLVHYPGLSHHPGHAVASRQMKKGFGGMMSFQVAGGEQASINVAAHLNVFHRATSLGGTESLVEHRASIEPPDSTTPKNLLRISVGLEDVDDLIHDLDQALKKSDIKHSKL